MQEAHEMLVGVGELKAEDLGLALKVRGSVAWLVVLARLFKLTRSQILKWLTSQVASWKR